MLICLAVSILLSNVQLKCNIEHRSRILAAKISTALVFLFIFIFTVIPFMIHGPEYTLFETTELCFPLPVLTLQKKDTLKMIYSEIYTIYIISLAHLAVVVLGYFIKRMLADEKKKMMKFLTTTHNTLMDVCNVPDDNRSETYNTNMNKGEKLGIFRFLM